MIDSPEMLTVSTNPWLSCAFWLTARFMIAGAAWWWLLPNELSRERSRGVRFVITAAGSAVIGTVLSLLVVLSLGHMGIYSATNELLVMAIFTAGGMALGIARCGKGFGQHVTSCLPGIVLFFVGTAVIMNLKAQGEWVLGGSDPGVYLNEGIYLERTATFYPAEQECYAALKSEELPLFARKFERHVECFPAVPFEPKTKAFHHYFFRLTPSLIAVTARSGSLRAAARVNLIMGLLVCLLLFAFLAANT